jgi:hypothetical protein
MTTIILTSTVNVDLRKCGTFQSNVNDRLDTYLKSILQWLTKTNFKIVLVENSGYDFDELNNEKILYKNRFEVITFIEKDLEEAKHCVNTSSKGNSEMFAINYAFHHSQIMHSSNFIIKITARYFINDLEEFLSHIDLDKYDCLTQLNRNRCEMVGSHYKHFNNIFGRNLLDQNGHYWGHVEDIWKMRTSQFTNILICKQFTIDPTQRGGVSEIYCNI